MKFTKIAVALAVSVSMLSLTACNDDNDSSILTQKPTFISEANYALDSVDSSSSIKVMNQNNQIVAEFRGTSRLIIK